MTSLEPIAALPGYKRINDRPERSLHSWTTFYRDEPRKGAPAVDVVVWVPRELAVGEFRAIAGYLEKHLGWKVHRNGGWSSGALLGPDELTTVVVKVRAREIRGALPHRQDPDWQAALMTYFFPESRTAAGRDAVRAKALLEMHEIESRYEAAVDA